MPDPVVPRGGGGASAATIALLDHAGVIVAVNRAWEESCIRNGGRLTACGVGASYLAVTDADDDPISIVVAQHIRDALEGQALVPLRVRLACDSPTAPRWFDLLISSRLDDRARCLGATVSFSPVVSSAAAGTATDQPAAIDSRFTVSEHATASLGIYGAAELARIGGQLQQRVVHELYATSLGICSILDRVGDPLALDRQRQAPGRNGGLPATPHGRAGCAHRSCGPPVHGLTGRPTAHPAEVDPVESGMKPALGVRVAETGLRSAGLTTPTGGRRCAGSHRRPRPGSVVPCPAWPAGSRRSS